MNQNFYIIESGIDVSPFLKVLEQNENAWQSWKSAERLYTQAPKTNGLIPLTLALVDASKVDITNHDDINSVMEQQNTPLYENFKVITDYLYERGFKNHARMGLFRLTPSEMNNTHTEHGPYYEHKNRYHLSMSGTYRLMVEDEERTFG